jgi:hypothetical protein
LFIHTLNVRQGPDGSCAITTTHPDVLLEALEEAGSRMRTRVADGVPSEALLA